MFIFMWTCDKFMVCTLISRICFLTQQPNLGWIDIDLLRVNSGFLVHFNRYKFFSRLMLIYYYYFFESNTCIIKIRIESRYQVSVLNHGSFTSYVR
jgi:hypothetical protein